MELLRIALDYDGTFTADPALWLDFIGKAEAAGHDVVCVTMRYPHEAIPPAMPCDVIYTSRKAKAVAVKADIWIDDKPHWLLHDSV
jgi:hypothetical protein